jgi:hypothetical protein
VSPTRLVVVIATAVLQALGVLLASLLPYTLFQVVLGRLILGTSPLQNALFFLFFTIVAAIGVGLFVLGHRIRKGNR